MKHVRVSWLLFVSLFVCSQAWSQVSGLAKHGDVAIHYQEFGEGFPIVLLSGGPGGSSSALLPIARILDDNYRVVLIDQRGTGKSQLAILDSTSITLENYVADV